MDNNINQNDDSTSPPPKTSSTDVMPEESPVEQPFSQDDLPF